MNFNYDCLPQLNVRKVSASQIRPARRNCWLELGVCIPRHFVTCAQTCQEKEHHCTVANTLLSLALVCNQCAVLQLELQCPVGVLPTTLQETTRRSETGAQYVTSACAAFRLLRACYDNLALHVSCGP
jgi:hypothetical protein